MTERDVFEAALELPPEDRAAYLEGACGDDAGLRQRLDGLLQKHDQAGSFLEDPAISALATVDDPAVSERPGTVIGPYKLLEQIGEGGFGIVFMAEQQQPLRRKVALKVLKPGMDTKQVIARFEAERQALALMDQPNIARVLDGGAMPSGRPYFVMELVKGMPITDYCDQSQLTPRERLELFLPVCQAVQHAHQKGIIHRDIKPSNVLVTLQDGLPLVKVIDFGIAKALGQQLTDKTLFTNFAQLLGTPLYMSPEQAAFSNVDVDTRSDIYSLGVLLYELLTGTTPFDKERLREAGYDEMRRIIREEEPSKPSTRVSTLGQAATTVSTNRKSNPRRLSQLFRGELDWIVMRCLEKDRNRRYVTANSLALDLQRYLHHEPVQACPQSAMYRLRKFGRRNKGMLVTAALLGMTFLVAVGAVAGSFGWAARDRAARVAVAEANVSQALNDAIALEDQAKWLEALEAVKRAEGFLPGTSSVDLSERAHELRRDVEMVRRVTDMRLARALGNAGVGYDHAWADTAYAEAFREYGVDVDVLMPMEAAARIRSRRIRPELAAALDYWASQRRNHKPDGTGWRRIVAVARAADPEAWRNQVRDAMEQVDRTALVKLAASQRLGDLPRETLSLLGEVLEGLGSGQQSLAVLRFAQLKYPDDFHITFQLAWAFDHQTGERTGEEVIRFYTVARALNPGNVLTNIILAHVLQRHGKHDEAAAVFRKVTELDVTHVRLPGPQLNQLAWLLITSRNANLRSPRQAVELAQKAVELTPRDASYWNTLGVARYRAGNWKDAIIALQKSLGLHQGHDSYNWFFLAMAHGQLGEIDAARDCYRQGVEWMQKNDPNDGELRLFRAEAEGLLKVPRNDAQGTPGTRIEKSN
jgi:serine/threonine protein kinase/tetratricopeptide (TPR) repeat protein